jgi:ankyrin repeat protein
VEHPLRITLQLGQSHVISTGSRSSAAFNLALNDSSYGNNSDADSDGKLTQMLASQARLREDGAEIGDEDSIINNKDLSEEDKRDALQNAFAMAASNGDVERVRRLVSGTAKDYVDINRADAEGTPPLIYASCFGHEDVVTTLLQNGADVNIQDRNQWSPLMWAMTNRHKNISKVLLDNGANPDVKSSTGRTAFDFIAPNSEISDYLHESGYNIGNAGVTDDFYSAGFSQDRFEEEMAENEMKRRMMMESAINLEVDLGNLGLDEQPEVSNLRVIFEAAGLTLVVARGNRRRSRVRLGQMPQ